MMQQLKIGTRASPLAMKQAEMVKQALQRLLPECDITLHAMTTRGDKEQGKPLSDWGFKGLFTKELEVALLEGQIDIAVHSVKDMPSELPEGLHLAATLPRDDVRDAWISEKYPDFSKLPKGVVIGTASERRRAQALRLHPDARIVPLRGNVQTRLAKISDGAADGTFLSCAGLDRMQLERAIAMRIGLDVMLPAAAQGTIGIECRKANAAIGALLQQVNCPDTFTAIAAERALLKTLDGSCKTPIAAYAHLHDGQVRLRAQIIAPDGSGMVQETLSGDVENALVLGEKLGHMLRENAPKHWLQEAVAC